MPAGRRLDLVAQRAEHAADRALERLQRDVAGEAVADDDVGLALEQRRGPRCCPRNAGRTPASSACASSVSWLPFSGSSPIESRRTRGSRTPRISSAKTAPMRRELHEVLGPRVGVRAGVDQHRWGRGVAGITTAIPGRWTPGSRLTCEQRRGEHGAGVAGRDARRAASPSPTARTARTSDESGFVAHRLGGLVVHRDRRRVHRRARQPACRARRGPKRTGVHLVGAPPSSAPATTSSGALSPPRASTATAGRHGGQGAGVRSGCDFAAPVGLAGGAHVVRALRRAAVSGTSETRGASIPCCARRLSRRAFEVFRLGTAMSGRALYPLP